jgi:hypothetical protein
LAGAPSIQGRPGTLRRYGRSIAWIDRPHKNRCWRNVMTDTTTKSGKLARPLRLMPFVTLHQGQCPRG